MFTNYCLPASLEKVLVSAASREKEASSHTQELMFSSILFCIRFLFKPFLVSDLLTRASNAAKASQRRFMQLQPMVPAVADALFTPGLKKSGVNPSDLVTDEMHQNCNTYSRHRSTERTRFFSTMPDHIAQPIAQKWKELGDEVLLHLPRSPDLSRTDYQFFKRLDSFLQGKTAG